MGHLEQGPQSSQIFSATLPSLKLPLLGGTFHFFVVRLYGGRGAVLLGMRPALGLGQSGGQGSGTRLEQLPMASPMVFP